MDLGAGGSWRGVLREWAGSAGWSVGLSVFVNAVGMLCFWNTRKDKHIHNKNIRAETENSELVCKHSPPPQSPNLEHPEHNQGTAEGTVLSQTAQRRFGEVVPQLPPPPRTYDLQYFTPNLKISKTNRISGILFTVAVQSCLFKLGLLAVGRMRLDLVKGAEGGPITLPGASAWRDTVSPEHFWYQLGTEFHSGDVQPGSVGESARFSFPSYMLETRPPSKAVCCLVTYLSAVNLWLQVIHPKNQGKDREIEYIQFI